MEDINNHGDLNFTEASGVSIHLSDVIAVIESTDPAAQRMFQNQDVTTQMANTNHSPININQENQPQQESLKPYVAIIEQPAPKALRFRYECEGRSAGSIPGANSTPDNKTYPTIQVKNYVGRAVVVVSCVTKDAPYKPHPHSLVGREGCRRGVCTLEINTDDMKLAFSNLGIQCVKKRDIEEALKTREEIRVDPYRTGYDHRNQPSSIDLNAVRLCFQVFLEGPQKGKFTTLVKPVVSEPIYDKKSMSDLVITKLSHCNALCNGGQEMILLCEKVAKEDIGIRFYEEAADGWEGFGEFQHSQVHKQVAISFRTPRFKAIDISEPVRVKVQLRRPSDGATSEPLDFEMLPLNEGRRGYWNIQRELKKRSATTDLFQQLLDDHDSFKIKVQEGGEDVTKVISQPLHEVVNLVTPVEENSKFIDNTTHDEKTINWLENAEFIIDTNNNENDQNLLNQSEDDKALNELLEQVAELDVIYQDHQLRRDTDMLENDLRNLDQSLPKEGEHQLMDMEDAFDFDDAATYTSLQKAFKHPLDISEGPPVPPKPGKFSDGTTFDLMLPPIVINPATPDILGCKRDVFENEKLPPLPPKRAKKVVESYTVDKENIVENKDDQNGISRHSSNRSLIQRTPSQIVIKSADVRRSPSHKLPPKPISTSANNSPKSSPKHATLPKTKKPGFFSKIFSRKKSKPDIGHEVGKDESIFADQETVSMIHFNPNDPNRESIRSTRSLKPTENKAAKPGKAVGRSVSSVSGKRPYLTPDIVHIPLKGDSSNSLPLRGSESNTHLSLPGNDFYERASTASLHPIDHKTISALQLADVPISDGDMELVAIADAQSLRNLCEGEYGITLDPSVDLTEAEHYALYTTLAPHATESEFDEASCYYQPVESEVNEIRRKRQRSGDDAAVIAFKNSPVHDGPSYAQRGFNVINDQPVKIEPREQNTSPYLHFPGDYRDPSHSTPSPQPQQISPPMFSQVSPSPSPYNNNNHNMGQILQNQLQAPRVTTNNFQHQETHGNQIYTPNIQHTTFPSGSNSIWTNNINGNDPTISRAFFNNTIPSNAPTSSIFNQPLTPLLPNNLSANNEPMGSSILIDLDNQILNNLSGDLQCLSFSDFAMDSFSKTGEKVNKL
ncbi:CLUMA_CG007684, isoform C [Clunio marinus]|uniref:CLUMA_CG007684, isoform C n=2 Tax=Clunio marinus TaxID=568069 RepID=A0A1J1I1G5_9DIPT|nr:CLUMA_CG007684, isoform C [Clunio marinus]